MSVGVLLHLFFTPTPQPDTIGALWVAADLDSREGTTFVDVVDFCFNCVLFMEQEKEASKGFHSRGVNSVLFVVQQREGGREGFSWRVSCCLLFMPQEKEANKGFHGALPAASCVCNKRRVH